MMQLLLRFTSLWVILVCQFPLAFSRANEEIQQQGSLLNYILDQFLFHFINLLSYCQLRVVLELTKLWIEPGSIFCVCVCCAA